MCNFFGAHPGITHTIFSMREADIETSLAVPAHSSPWALFCIYLRLGLTSFGGSAAHLGNAAVVGILLAALYDPVWTSGVHAGRDFALVAVALVLLAWWVV